MSSTHSSTKENSLDKRPKVNNTKHRSLKETHREEEPKRRNQGIDVLGPGIAELSCFWNKRRAYDLCELCKISYSLSFFKVIFKLTKVPWDPYKSFKRCRAFTWKVIVVLYYSLWPSPPRRLWISAHHMCAFMHVGTHRDLACVKTTYIYIYMHIERDRDRGRGIDR